MRHVRVGVLASALCAVALAGCGAKMRRVSRVLAGYQAAFELHAEADPRAVIGQPLELRLVLTNRGPKPIQACIGPDDHYTLVTDPIQSREGRPPSAGIAHLTDHPTCVRRFALAPGESFSWVERPEFADIGAGGASLSASVQVLSLSDCNEYGCYGIDVEAPAVRLQLVREP